RLVPVRLLCRLSRAQPAGTGNRSAAGFSRRLLAPSHQSDTLRRALEYPSRIPLRRLRLSRGVHAVALRGAVQATAFSLRLEVLNPNSALQSQARPTFATGDHNVST